MYKPVPRSWEWYKMVYTDTPENELRKQYEEQHDMSNHHELPPVRSCYRYNETRNVGYRPDYIIRSGAIIYDDVQIGNDFKTGHNILIRDRVVIGDNVLVGTNVVIEGHVKIGSNVSIQTGAYICTDVIIEDNVFIGPHAVLTNDKYPIRYGRGKLVGPRLRKGCSIGANATILGGVEIGEGSLIGSGAVVTKDIPDWKVAMGNPAKIIDMDDDLKVLNKI